MLEIFPYLGGSAKVLASVRAESNCRGWFRGTVACMTMAVDCANLAELFVDDPADLDFGK